MNAKLQWKPGVLSLPLAVFLLSAACRASSGNIAKCAATNDPDLSISACTTLIQSRHEAPTYLAIAFYNRGNAYYRKGQYDRAIDDYDQAIRLNSEYAKALANRGAYNNKRSFDRAIEDFDRAINLDPSNAAVFKGRGNVYINKGQFDRAIKNFDQAIRVAPNDAGAFGDRARAYDGEGQYSAAISDWNQYSHRTVDRRRVEWSMLGQGACRPIATGAR
jgi:tetratricopeptide (TPR) repeat protein